jgi:hypothetical protein
METTKLEQELQSLIKHWNDKYSKEMLLPFTIRNGDEVIGIFHRYAAGYQALDDILENSRKLAVYAGCGFGDIYSTDHIDVHTSNSPAIIYAIEARDQYLKKNKKEAALWNREFSNKAYFYGNPRFPFQAVNSHFYMIRSSKRKRSEKQQQIIHEIDKYPEKTYEEIGRMFNYKNPRASISNHLRAANYELVNEMEKSLAELLDLLQDVMEGKI